MATTTAWHALSSSSSTLVQNLPKEDTRTGTHPCPRTWTRNYALGWRATNGPGRPAQHRRLPRAGKTPPSPPPSHYMLRSGGRTGRSNRTRRPLPRRTLSLATPMVPWCRRVSPMMVCRELAVGRTPAHLRALCSHHLPGDLPLAGLFQPGRLPCSGQPPSSSPSPHCPCGVCDSEPHGNGGLAHLTMKSATAPPHADASGNLQGIWGAGPAGSVSELSEAGARIIPDSVPIGPRAHRSSPVHGAIRTAASGLSAAISLAQDLGQTSPTTTHHSLAQSLKITSEILREASEELMEVAQNQSSSTVPETAPAAATHMECDD